jgi:tetratricopeptide (TPR) repeat protein
MADRSVVGRNISQSVVVTGDGNTVTLTLGDSGVVLPLRRRQFRPPDRRRRPAPGEPPRELDLLVPEAGRLPLIGRKDIFVELQAWIDDAVDISVHALIGRAGSGKTRLALEFCALIDNDPIAKGGWLAGFLSPSELTPVVDTLATRHFVWARPTLLVIDYAAQCHEALARWLDRLAGQKLETKLRLLLLDREAPEGFGWWRELTGSGLNTARERRDLFYSLRPRQLPDLSDLEERRNLMEAALQGARDLRSMTSDGLQIPPAGADQGFDKALAEPQFGNPLALVMAGGIALDQGPRAALALRHLEAARRLGRRELDRFAALAQTRGVSRDVTCHIVGYNELVDGIPIPVLRESVAKELATRARSADADIILPLLQQELPPRTRPEEAASGPRLATLQPDLIGEAAIIEAFTGEPSRELEADKAVGRAYALVGQETARVLVRLLQDFAYAIEDESATEQEKAAARRLMGWLLSLSQHVEDPEQLLPLVFALPEQTTILREPAAELTQRLVAHFREVAERSKELSRLIPLATLLSHLAGRLRDLGRREAALAAAEEAGHHYRALATARPNAFTSDLAMSLSNLANRLSDLGQCDQALAAAQEAVRLCRALTVARPDAFDPGLAMSLVNLAAVLSDLGRREEALAAAKEAVRHYRALTGASPDAFTPNLAMSLNNLATTLSALGRREEALAAAEEASSRYRALAASRPDAVNPDLALSLHNLANRLNDLGRREDALKAIEEAVRLRRALATARPNAFGPDLAMSLNNFAGMLSALGRREEALRAVEEAVRHYRALAAARPDAFTPNLGGALTNLSNRLSALGQRAEALAAAEEAVRHYRALAATRPDAFTPDLAGSIINLGNRLSELGRREEALTEAEEAVRHYRALAAALPEAFTPNLALSLNNLGGMLSTLGEHQEALTAAQEAVRHYRALAAARPEAFTPGLAGFINNLAVMLSDLGRQEEALVAAEEAVRLRRDLAALSPEAFTPDLAMSLNNLAMRFVDLGRCEDALLASEEAVRLRRNLAAARPDVFSFDLARSLWLLGDLYGETGKSDRAIGTLAEAVRLITPIFVAIPAAVAEMVSGLAQSYVRQCEAAGREPDHELLGPVIAEFERLNAKEEDK